MESFKIEKLSFTYPNRYDKALKNINLTVDQGEFVLLCGMSGCGKTTLLRLLKPSLSPHGELDGKIDFFGKPLSDYGTREEAGKIGFVMQNPDNQIVTDKVWHELAFGLESLGTKTPEIRAKVSEMASFFGIEGWFHKNVTELSGGQKQLLNLASVMVMNPSVLILDEPTSQLDPIAAQEFLQTVKKINRELGTTVILAEHRLEDAFSLADKVIVMDSGEIIINDEPKKVGEALKRKKHTMMLALPTPVRVYGSVDNNLSCPLTVAEGRCWLMEYVKENEITPEVIPSENIKTDDRGITVEIKDGWFRYEKNSPDVLKNFNLTAKKGELLAVLGGNGTGKTTALSVISGLLKPYRGEVLIKGQNISGIKNLYNGLIGYLPQNPQTVFVKNTVRLDLEDMLSEDIAIEKVQKVAELCGIESILDFHPYDLSGGEQQRAALAKMLLKEPEILLLDEPTKGMDAHFKIEFAGILEDLKKKGTTIIMVSHDIEFCAEFADNCALVFDGNITSEGTPREFFSGKNFYTTSANRMARICIPDAVLCDDIIKALGGKTEVLQAKKRKTDSEKPNIKSNDNREVQKPTGIKKKMSLKSLLSFMVLLLLVPVTLFFGLKFFGGRKYYFTSLLIILETILAFSFSFESRKPKAREIVLISVLCAIATAGRTAFLWIPQFKPVVAFVIIAGVCFGGETGFLVGSVTGLVSNFFFGQGPWTPWQMFSFGIIGFLAGILFNKGVIEKGKIPLCIFGFLATFFIYGGIMNPSSLLMVQANPTLEMILANYAAGAPLDFVHAISTVFFLYFISQPMIEKFERVKVKYGLLNIEK